MPFRAAIPIAFLSGFVALGYEILWARRLSDLIGATALASSLVIGVFFLLLALGAIALGPLATRSRSPWRTYAALEAGILVAILPAFFGEALTDFVATRFGDSLLLPGAGFALKLLLALALVGPASFLMGGTLPAMGQAVVRAGRLGREGNVLYGTNTLGGAAGIVVTTFAFVPELGMRRSFGLLMLGSLILASVALWFAARGRRAEGLAGEGTGGAVGIDAFEAHSTLEAPESEANPDQRIWIGLAFVSGFNVLGYEVLALHLFSQVLHNSTYSFAIVLVLVIAALAAGALVTQRWRLDAMAARQRLAVVLLSTGLAAALVPRFFYAITGNMRALGPEATTLGVYIVQILGTGALVLGPVFVLAGWVFPLVLAGAGAAGGARIGARWGSLLGFNAAGALLGLVLANVVCMRFLGLWMSLAVWSLVPLLAGVLLVPGLAPRTRRIAWGGAGAATLALVVAFPASLPVANLGEGEQLVAWSAGADGVAAVVSNTTQGRDRRIKWNNTYTLGGVANAAQQARMGHLALLLHPAPRRIGFIGIATGITASAALRDPAVESITAVELSRQITDMACRHFADVNGDLCHHPRVRTVVEDGRLFFRATRDSFDVVVGDLFVPWQAGTATLYTREQFRAVHDRLAPRGLFAQWLPLFQLDAVGFWGIATTFLETFPNAWVAIADFQPYNPAIALLGWRDPEGAPSYDVLASRCDAVRPLGRWREPMLADARGVAMFLAGPLAGAVPEGFPILTLDRTWLAEHAPRVQRVWPPIWFQGPPLVATLDRMASQLPDDDLGDAIRFGHKLYAFCEVFEREGAESAAAWYEAHVSAPLPSTNFAVDQPGRMNWPFPMQAGLALLQRARAEALAAP